MMNPTAEQLKHCHLAEQDVLELVRRLQMEGMDLRVIMAGIGSATTAAMLDTWGPEAPCIWFAQQSAMTMHLSRQG